MIYGFEGFAQANGLPPAERAIAAELVEIYEAHAAANAEKGRYYDQRVTSGECNLESRCRRTCATSRCRAAGQRRR